MSANSSIQIQKALFVLNILHISGDGEGANEMSWSMDYLRRLCRMFENSGEGKAVRVFFPDQKVQMTTYLMARMSLTGFSRGEESGLASIPLPGSFLPS